jgi:hypothetical protein
MAEKTIRVVSDEQIPEGKGPFVRITFADARNQRDPAGQAVGARSRLVCSPGCSAAVPDRGSLLLQRPTR